jgi:hypothetical protein
MSHFPVPFFLFCYTPHTHTHTHTHTRMDHTHPFTIHIADKTGRIVKTYHPKTGNELVCVTHEEMKEFDVGWPEDESGPVPSIHIRICSGEVERGDNATITFTYQHSFYPNHSVTGSDVPGTKVTAVNKKTGEDGDSLFSPRIPIEVGNITATEDGKIVKYE